MTPIEIFEYKLKWKPGYTVRLHSDLRREGKEYCKVQMFKQQWDLKTFTDVYEDTFYFQYCQDAKAFKNKFKEYVDM
tara:strand:- start:1559 stop:1789 length:231 start_codon:yes stop_codon:yes gene_type:complete